MGSARVSQEADPIVTSRPGHPGIAGFPFEACRSVGLKTPAEALRLYDAATIPKGVTGSL
jgi:hypothetical protein